MRNIFLFVWKHYFFFLFLLLELVCFIIIVQNNAYQQSAFIGRTNEFFASLNSKINSIYDYFNLTEINKQLAEENARLRAETQSALLITDKINHTVTDTTYKQEFTYTEARVVSNSINKRKNFIMINKGSSHGIKKDMGVIAPEGVVGIVTDVSPNYASVMSLLNTDTRISAKMKNSGQIGSLAWEGANYRKGKLNDMPTHVVMKPGDTVVTSGYSAIFPEGINAGFIIDYELKSGEIFYDVNVAFAVDFNCLSYVYVVKNILKWEQDLLNKRIENVQDN